jgi:hypothetical protein
LTLQWGRFFVHFSGENFGENSAEKFSPTNVGKSGIFRRKTFEKSFFQEIQWNFPRKVIFRGKKCTKNRPQISFGMVRKFERACHELAGKGERVFAFADLAVDPDVDERNCPQVRTSDSLRATCFLTLLFFR